MQQLPFTQISRSIVENINIGIQEIFQNGHVSLE